MSSAIFTLQAHNTQTQSRYPNDRTDESTEHLFVETEGALEDLTRMATRLCAMWDEESSPGRVSILLMQVVYQAASTITRLSQGKPDVNAHERLEALKGLLRRLSPRWRVAGKLPS
jgi:hypothetical protein